MSSDPKREPEKRSSRDNHALWFTRDTLSQAFTLGGCAVCSAVHVAERKAIHSFLREGMMFPHVRKQFLDGGGFCLRHFWMAKEIEDISWQTGGFGLAILCEDLTRLAHSGLDELASPQSNPRPALLKRRQQARGFMPGRDCMFCQDNREKETFLTDVLEELAGEDAFQKPLANQGFCIRHGQLAVERWKDSPERTALSSRLQLQITELAADLREFMRKRDCQYRQEPAGREHDSLLRAMHFFVGPNPCRNEEKKQLP